MNYKMHSVPVMRFSSSLQLSTSISLAIYLCIHLSIYLSTCISLLGIPSLPVVNNVTGGNGVATLLIQVSYSGVINSSDFNFIISIYNENDQLFDTQTINPDSQYFTGSMINGVITVNLEEGMYSFTVQSSNPYGMSEVTELTDDVIVINTIPRTPSASSGE